MPSDLHGRRPPKIEPRGSAVPGSADRRWLPRGMQAPIKLRDFVFFSRPKAPRPPLQAATFSFLVGHAPPLVLGRAFLRGGLCQSRLHLGRAHPGGPLIEGLLGAVFRDRALVTVAPRSGQRPQRAPGVIAGQALNHLGGDPIAFGAYSGSPGRASAPQRASSPVASVARGRPRGAQ